MSTDLVGVRILAVDRPKRRVRLRVFVVYYDCGGGYHEPLPHDTSFFGRTLVRAAAWHGTGGGLADAAPENDWYDEGWVDANTWRFIDGFEMVASRNGPLKDFTGYHDFYYCHQGRWQDEDRLVQADYDVFLTEERWLDGLVLGASYGDTSYSTCAATVDRSLIDRLPEPLRVLATFAPFPDSNAWIRLLVASSDGRWLAVGHAGGGLAIVDTTTFTVHRHLDLGAYPRGTVEGNRLLLADGRSLVLPDGEFEALTIAPRASRGVSCANERHQAMMHARHLELWDVPARKRLWVLDLPESASALTFSPSGDFVLATFGTQRARGFQVYGVATGSIVRSAVRIGPSPTPAMGPACWSEDFVAFVLARGDKGPDLVQVLGLGGAPPLEERPSSMKPREPGLMDPVLIRTIASGGAAWSAASLAEAVDAHRLYLEACPPPDREAFLAAAYPKALWQVLAVAGLPLAIRRNDEEHPPEGAARATFRIANLAGASLAMASLAMADFSGAYAPGIDLGKADLFGATMTDATLSGASFAGADLRAADLSRADLTGAKFRGALLESTDFEGADLTGADFTGAAIGGVKLKYARLDGVCRFGEGAKAEADLEAVRAAKPRPRPKKKAPARGAR